MHTASPQRSTFDAFVLLFDPLPSHPAPTIVSRHTSYHFVNARTTFAAIWRKNIEAMNDRLRTMTTNGSLRCQSDLPRWALGLKTKREWASRGMAAWPREEIHEWSTHTLSPASPESV